MKDSKKSSKISLPRFRSSKSFEISEKHSLSKLPTNIKKLYESDKEADRLLQSLQERLSDLQEVLYAEGRQSLVIILQGMDTAGKDGLTKHVMSGVNPQGVVVTSFKRPTSDDLSHDFLWRGHVAMPRRGEIGIFNRSYYEEVVVTRVHPDLLQAEQLPLTAKANDKFWDHRVKDIVHFEKYLERQGFTMVKFFLNLSKSEQKKRLESRIANSDKHWKFDPQDITEREHWTKYQEVYADVLKKTSHDQARWFAIPADDKVNARLIALTIIIETLESMHLQYPRTSPQKKREIEDAKKRLR